MIGVLTLVTSAVAAFEPLPMKLLVDNALHGLPLSARVHAHLDWLVHPTPPVLVAVAAGATLAFYALSSLLSGAMTWTWSLAGQGMVNELAGDLFQRLQRQSLLVHARRPVGDSLDRLSTDSWCVYTFTSNVLMAPVQHLTTFLSIGLVAFQLDAGLASLTFVSAPLLAVSAYLFGRRLKKRARKSRERQSKLVSLVQQTFSTLLVTQAFGAEDRNTARFRALAGEAVEEAERNAMVNRTFGLVNGAVVTLVMASVLMIGGLRALAGTLSVGTLLVFLAYMRTLQNAADGLTRIYGHLKQLEASMDRVGEVLASPEAVVEAADARPLPPAPLAIRFEDVRFGYVPGHPVLHDLSLEVEAGRSLALVGPSGAGKSTLVSLVPRLFDPWQGRVLVNGEDLRGLQLAGLRECITVVPQEPFLLPISVADNIAYGRRGASRQEVVEAAVAANADAFVRQLPQGYDTVLGERGVTLSGGEKQRLAIARALLKDTPIVILDEPTSALDSGTERLVVQALERLLEGRTTLIIAHRLSTIRFADRIAVLEHGRLVEVGTRAEVMAGGLVGKRLDLSTARPMGLPA